MGSGQSSSVRSSQFTREKEKEEPVENDEEQHISISNKMVERLVEDASLTVDAESAATAVTTIINTPQPDHKELLFIEKLKALDDTHSERTGLTIEEMRAMHKRIEMRQALMPDVEDVCPAAAAKVIECYNREGHDNVLKCWESVAAFSKCVQDSTTSRVHSRTARLAMEQARLSRNVELAREHSALRDIAPKLMSEATS